MVLAIGSRLLVHRLPSIQNSSRCIHSTSLCLSVQSGKYKQSVKGDKPLTYEMANPPPQIAHRKSWNSWNTANLIGEPRASETTVEEIFIRKFMVGTWHGLILSEVIIKRQHNMIRIGAIIGQNISPRKIYFLIGYTEELLAHWLQCPIKLELQAVSDKKAVVFKYI